MIGKTEQELYSKVASLKGEFDILCIGELLTDYISKEEKPLKEISVFDKFFGGSPANIVFHMKNMGKKPVLITKIGKDDDGKFLLKTLKKYEIIQEHVKIDKERETTKSFIKRSPGTPEFEILRGADTQLSREEIDFSLIKKSKIVHTNAFSLAEEPTRSTVLAVMEEAHRQGKLISFDPNYRSAVWPDKKEALKVLEKAYRFVDLTKPSSDDAKEIFGSLTPREHVKMFHQLGAKTVVLTMGNKGSLISAGRKSVSVPAEHCDAKDATGAGDIYWSIFLTALLDGAKLESAGRKASFAATRVVSKEGAILDDKDYDEIAAYMRLF